MASNNQSVKAALVSVFWETVPVCNATSCCCAEQSVFRVVEWISTRLLILATLEALQDGFKVPREAEWSTFMQSLIHFHTVSHFICNSLWFKKKKDQINKLSLGVDRECKSVAIIPSCKFTFSVVLEPRWSKTNMLQGVF